MTRRNLLIPLVFMVLLALVAVGASAATDTKPTLGLDLQGGFSVVLQAKEVNGRLPSEESVEKAKDIIRQRVDGLGVAEPDITRQGRTVIVQLPGVKNRKKAEALVGCTARLEFRSVLASTVNPDSVTSTPSEGGKKATTTTTTTGSTTTGDGGATTTTAASGGQGETGLGETGTGMVGLAPGEGALPGQFAPTTTTTEPPTTTTTEPPTTTTIAGSTTVPGDTSTTIAGGTTATTAAPGTTGTSSSCGAGATGGSGSTATTVAPDATGGAQFPSDDGKLLYTLGPVGFTGDVLSKATALLNNGEWTVNVSVKNAQKDRANAAFNECYAGGTTCPAQNAEGRGGIAIVLDGEVLSAPAVNGPDLAADQFTITGGFGEGEAKDLALVLRYGSLPVEFEQAALQQVSATLGADSLRAGLVAGLIGVAALALYMIGYYRGFGLVVVVSLVVWSALMYGLVCLLSANQGLALTLAGITGIIVSVGTTVDTYVVVFERVKDELRSGRSVRSATERGYQSGIKTVFTANGAAFIGAFLLWYLTVGPVRGFAYFLGISVILDLLVAVLFTRPLILLLSRSPRFARARFLGIGTSTDQANAPKANAPRVVPS